MLNESIEGIKAYLSGYFDGEGSIWLSKPSKWKPIPQLTISVATADFDSLKRFESIFGGKVKSADSSSIKRQIYRWCSYGKEAQNALRFMLPYLEAKKFPALWALECEFGGRGGKRGSAPSQRRVEESEILFREGIQLIINEFNNRETVKKQPTVN